MPSIVNIRKFIGQQAFQAIINFIELRDKPDAQWEIRQYAEALKKQMLFEIYPKTAIIWSEIYWEKSEKKP